MIFVNLINILELNREDNDNDDDDDFIFKLK